jgi:hypothetical protein
MGKILSLRSQKIFISCKGKILSIKEGASQLVCLLLENKVGSMP